MKFPESWLRTFVDPMISSDELAALLTMSGLEVEEMESVAPDFRHVVVAGILEVRRHPDADRLNVCVVDTGEGAPRQIVCGAPNAVAGMKAPCALPGAVLPGNLSVKAARLRGVDSAGMLCSAKELGISDEASGLLVLPPDAPAGTNIRQYLDLDDKRFTLKLTPNRADCLSLAGIAREVSALTGVVARFPAVSPAPVTVDARRAVRLDAPAACPRYCGRVIEDVDARAPTPEWMRRRLERSGVRCISALVDVTNYVLLELGQPLHAFDAQKLSRAIHVRTARSGEQLRLLNEQTVTLADDVLVIADDLNVLAMAGIMGGEMSGVTMETQSVFLESAFFTPGAVAGRARRYNFSSDASHRYERGVDFANVRNALERATQLILEICGGKAGPVTEAVSETHLPARPPVRLRPDRVSSVLGMAFQETQIAGILERLLLPFTREGKDFLVTPPSYRFDLAVEEDLIEEVARIHGYDNLPARAPEGRLGMLAQPETRRPLAVVRQQLADRGFQEVINFAFVEEAWETDFAANATPVRLANPIASQLAVMRSTLIGGLVENLSVNLRRKQSRVRLFETGRCFSRDARGAYLQPWRLAALAYGPALPEGWGNNGRNADFFDLKGDLEALLSPATAAFARLEHPALHPGRAAGVHLDGACIGWIGELHPRWVQKYGLPTPPVLFEIELERALQARLPAYAEVSKFQPAIRDLAIVVDRDLPLEAVFDAMRQCAPPLVSDVRLFDLYQGKGIPEGKKSLAFRIVIQDTECTLLDADIDASVVKIAEYLAQNLNAQRRA
ncbi:MAG: phenylalanine--tRNA ligase subunit beta [Zoogloeaceae bacterium]|jgi:phenylalanyl-tRNA synthetase beta chain|nr:phenylalanine--tRNA ligase subunit beta [Zoogloeaceae bacterium]